MAKDIFIDLVMPSLVQPITIPKALLETSFNQEMINRSDNIATEYTRSSSKAGKVPAEVADFREGAIKEFLSNFFPFPYRLSKGVVHDSFANVSGSIDIVLLNPMHPYTIESSGKFSLILAEGVDAGIEIKSDPYNQSEINICIKQSKKFKSLKRHSFRDLKNVQESVPYFVYFMKNTSDDDPSKLSTTVEYIFKKAEEENEEYMPDYFVFHNRGVLQKINDESRKIIGGAFKDENIFMPYIFMPWGSLTLSGFLYYLCMKPAQPTLTKSVLIPYIKPMYKELEKTLFGKLAAGLLIKDVLSKNVET